MKRLYSCLFFITLLALSSCKQDLAKVVTAVTDGILEPVSITITPGVELGEIIVGDVPVEMKVIVKNNSTDRIRKIVLDIDKSQTLLKFRENSSGDAVSPGEGGTCYDLLTSGSSCYFILLFNPRKSGTFSIPVKLKYENLISPQEKEFTVTALTGEPASLVFANDISNYDLGVIEQTEKVKRFLDLDIINKGGLSAKDITTSLMNSSSDEAYKIEENDCPKNLEPGKSCKIKLSYEPFNNNYTDNAIDYKSQLTLVYQRDSKGTMSNLNNYATFKSATIEANFKENFKTIDFGVATTGNKVTKSVRITNIGFRAGIIKEMLISDYLGNPITTCKKGATALLDCQKELKDFPFIIEDTNNCFENLSEGITGKAPGQNCFFAITYWPSLTWGPGSQSTHYFNEAKISLNYDSQWKGNEHFVTKNDMFEMYADFLSVAKLAFQEVIINSTPLDLSKIIFSNAAAEIDLGRLALVSSAAYSTYIKITWKNIGENIAILDSIYDGHSPLAHQISEMGYDLNTFYRQIKASAGCGFISPGATCNINFNLTPVLQADSTIEDQYMFDNVSDPQKKIKNFILKYEDGSKFEDDGSISSKRLFENNLVAKLIKKGKLAFTNNATLSTKIIHGETGLQSICLTNVGTGDIFAIKEHPSENYKPQSDFWPYRAQDLATVTSSCTKPATKDCYDIIYSANATLPMSPESAKFLAAGETCILSVEVKISEAHRKANYIDDDNYKRPFGPDRSGTEKAWERVNFNKDASSISYYYYDGDYVSTDAASFLNYGYKGSTIQKTTVSVTGNAPSNVVLANPMPITSALLHRPAISYPTLSSNYPVLTTLPATSTPEAFFTRSYFSLGVTSGFTKSDDAITHFKTLNLTGSPYDSQYKIHLGTFPVGETFHGSFDFINTNSGAGGVVTATNVTLTDANDPTNPIQIESYYNLINRPFPTISMVANQLVTTKLKFTPTAPGMFSRCFTMDYFDGLQNQQQYVCAYAEAVTTSARLKIEYKDVEVTMPGPTESTVGAPFVNLPAPINSLDAAFTTFTGIKDSSVYAKKIFRITNIGTLAAKKLNYYYMDSVNNANATIPTDTSLDPAAIKGCSKNITLNSGDYCEFEVKYQPLKNSSAALNRYLGFIYEIVPDSKQYISQVASINFASQDPAKLVVANVTPESITSWSVPTAPIPVPESWPFDLNAYNKTTNVHLLLVNKPEVKNFSIVTLRNISALKASFLYMNAAPDASAWNEIYSNSFINVKANRACFYGDDEYNGAVPSSQKGFNATTVAPCQLQIQFSGYQTYTGCSAWSAPVKTKTIRIGDNIESTCNPYSFILQYYNNNRASYEKMDFHVKGYIETNRSTTAPTAPVFSNVSSTFVSGSVGRASFSWPDLSANNVAWGSMVKYRIYYDTIYSNLNGTNIFKLTGAPTFVETTNTSTNSITINNLTVGRYYYFRVVAVRSLAGVNFISNSNLPLLTLPIPAADHTYSHETKTLIDKTYLPSTGNRPAGVTACKARTYNLTINGGSVKPTKTLITTPTWNYLITNPAASTGYPSDGIGSLPHWLNDAAYNMKTNISLYDGTVLPGFPGYLPNSMNGSNVYYQAMYQKNCNNNASCDLLYKIVGGDDVDLYFQGVFFAKDTAVQAFHRCQAIIRCPTSTGKLITDGSCVAP